MEGATNIDTEMLHQNREYYRTTVNNIMKTDKIIQVAPDITMRTVGNQVAAAKLRK